MISQARNALLVVASSLLVLSTPGAHAANDIQVGDVQTDPPTICCLGFSVPVTGDDNYDAAATIEYREAGFTTWRPGLSLLRVRPDLTSEETPPGIYGLPVPETQFAGSLFGLEPGTQYEVRITVADPDGGDRTQTVIATTRPLPVGDPAVPRVVTVANSTELNDAIAVSQPGDVIEIAGGTYSGPLTISSDGTPANPIILRGESIAAVTIDASGATYGITVWGDHVYLEQVTVSGSTWGARTYNTDGVVIRNSRFTDVNRGIYAKSGTNRNFYICDNVLEGQHAWPNVSSSTWDDEGITVSGEGHTICHNTLSGFGDALGLANSTNIPNIAIDFYGNDVLWTGDDGLELDFAHRNVRAFGNRITNAAMGASLQPVWGGPVYIFRNLFLNLAASAYKLNNDPNGFFIYHNTSARTLGPGNWGAYAWTSLGYTQSDGDPAYAANFEMKNNILVGLSDPAYVTTDLILEVIDYNGWLPDGAFRFVDTWVNFADLQSNSPYEANGRILDDATFATPLGLPPDYTSFWSNTDVTLGDNSLAIDGALPIPNINDDYAGIAPDLGAIEMGDAMPAYGVRSNDTTVPDVVGLTQAQATTAITAADLVIGTVTQQSDDSVLAGNVISQSPTAGTVVTEGSAVDLVISSGPDNATVPDVVGLTQAQATTAITAADLIIGTVTQQSDNSVPAGNVISQSPTAGTEVAQGSAVDLVISSGPDNATVPDVVGLTQAQATTAITTANLVIGTVTQQSDDSVPAGNVINQSPTAGTVVTEGSAVDLVISSGPDNATVPDVVGLTQAQATTAITAADLVIGTVTQQSDNSVPAGNVISQSPTAGTEVAQGSAVDLVISSGPFIDTLPPAAPTNVRVE